MPRLGLISNLTGGAPPSEAVLVNNYSLGFDGANDYVSIDSADFELSTFSISAWVRYNGSHAGTYSGIVSVGNMSAGKGMALGTEGSHTNVTFYAKYTSGGWKHPIAAVSMTVDEWAHLVVTYDGTTTSLYKDKVAATSTAHSGDIVYTDISKLYIGRDGGVSKEINGNIDEVSFWNKALSSSEVGDIYNDGVPTDLSGESGLLAYWRFETGELAVAVDSSGNGNHAALTHSPVWSTDVPS